MTKPPRISGRQIKPLEKAGFYVKRQEGSHVILRHEDPFVQLVVPDHKELDRGTLRASVRKADPAQKNSICGVASILSPMRRTSKLPGVSCGDWATRKAAIQEGTFNLASFLKNFAPCIWGFLSGIHVQGFLQCDQISFERRRIREIVLNADFTALSTCSGPFPLQPFTKRTAKRG